MVGQDGASENAYADFLSGVRSFPEFAVKCALIGVNPPSKEYFDSALQNTWKFDMLCWILATEVKFSNV